MQSYTITELSKILGIGRGRVVNLIKKGQIKFSKSKKKLSPYTIPSSEIDKIKRLLLIDEPKKQDKAQEAKNNEEDSQIDKYEDLIEIQKALASTMQDIASTQNKMASTLSFLLKK